MTAEPLAGTATLLDWLDAPRADHGLSFASDDGTGWAYRAYPELAGLAHGAAGQLVDAGIAPGDVVCLVLPTGEEFVAGLFGTWRAGATACPVIPPGLFQRPREYVSHLATVLATAKPSTVVTTQGLVPVVGEAVAASGHQVRTCVPEPRPAGTSRARPPAHVAILQFTSGSSGAPRAARVTFDNLHANTDTIRRWLEWTADDGAASWLPLYHDMGLIGCFLTSMRVQSDLHLMRPDQFVRDPARWLACFGEGRAVITASPPFGYAYCARRVAPDRLAGLDFGGWRAAIVGAEPIDPASVEAFARLLEPHGFRRGTLLPGYGLAEATLVVTGSRPRADPIVVRAGRLRPGEVVPISARTTLGDAALTDTGDGERWLIGCGPPTPNVDVRVVGADGVPLPDERLGEVVVSGPSVVDGYQGAQDVDDDTDRTRVEAGTLHTGDAAFRSGGELFVVGRISGSVKVRGRSVFLEDLDGAVVAATGLSRGHCAVVSSPGGQAGVALIVEEPPGDWVTPALQTLRRELGPTIPLRVLTGARGLILRGSSGKPSRALIWDRLTTGDLPGTTTATDP